MRIRYVNDSLSENVISFLNENKNVAQKILRVNREKVFYIILNKSFKMSINYDTIIHLVNHCDVNCGELKLLEDSILKVELDNFFVNNVN